MANTLHLSRNGAVGFIGRLDVGTWLINGLFIIRAVAVASLPSASRTSLYIAAEDVKFSFNHAAIMTGLAICSPVLCFLAVSEALIDLAADSKCCGDTFFHAAVNLTRRS